MISLLLLVFLLQLTIHLINTVGAGAITSLNKLARHSGLQNWVSPGCFISPLYIQKLGLKDTPTVAGNPQSSFIFPTSDTNFQAWLLYSKLPTPTSKQARDTAKLRNEVVRLKLEMNATSAQDEFSKWAKLRRQHDKVLMEHEKASKELGSFKSQFDSVVNALRWLATNGLRLALQMWFQKQPMFWLPKGWIPYYAEWLLSFPRAPVGGISIQVWTSACGAVITLVSTAVAAAFALGLQGKDQKSGKSKVGSAGAAAAEKKEL